MALRKVLRMGDPRLRETSESVPETEIRSKEIKKLIRDMFDTMEQESGVGLAAPQLGVQKRIFVIGFDRGQGNLERYVVINPELQILDGPLQGFWEGCLSVPGMRGYVERSRKIRLKWTDENEETHDRIIEGFDAVVFQHEFDHLNGTLYVDRIADTKKFGFNDELDAARVEERKERTL